MPEDDVSPSYRDQLFLNEIETALESDLRQAGILSDVLWHSQSSVEYTFRFVFDSRLTSENDILTLFSSEETDSFKLGVSKPVLKEDDDYGTIVIVRVKRPKPGKLYRGDEHLEM